MLSKKQEKRLAELESRIEKLESLNRLYSIATRKLDAIHRLVRINTDNMEYDTLLGMIEEKEKDILFTQTIREVKEVPYNELDEPKKVKPEVKSSGTLGKVKLKCVKSKIALYKAGHEYDADFDGKIYTIMVDGKPRKRELLKNTRCELVIVR